jgi:hypothetical protein
VGLPASILRRFGGDPTGEPVPVRHECGLEVGGKTRELFGWGELHQLRQDIDHIRGGCSAHVLGEIRVVHGCLRWCSMRVSSPAVATARLLIEVQRLLLMGD